MNAFKELRKSFDLYRLFAIIRHNITKMVKATAIGALLGYLVSLIWLALAPQYVASADVLVYLKDDPNTSLVVNDHQAEVNLITSYKDIMTSPSVLMQAQKMLASQATKDKYGKTYHPSLGQLRNNTYLNSNASSHVLTLTYKAGSPQEAAATANAIVDAFKQKAINLFNVNNISILSAASQPARPSFPNKRTFTIIGAAVGLALEALYLSLREYVASGADDQYLSKRLHLHKLGSIASIPNNSRKKAK